MLVILPSPTPELQHPPLLLQSATSQGMCFLTPCSFVVFNSDSHLSLSRSLGMCQWLSFTSSINKQASIGFQTIDQMDKGWLCKEGYHNMWETQSMVCGHGHPWCSEWPKGAWIKWRCASLECPSSKMVVGNIVWLLGKHCLWQWMHVYLL